jgi:hypothetical protein
MKFSKLLHINVTQRDIDLGVREKCDRCPVALAIQKMYPKCEAHVGGTYIRVGVPDNLDIFAIFDLPASAWAFIGAFDKGLGVKPFQFVAKLDPICTPLTLQA